MAIRSPDYNAGYRQGLSWDKPWMPGGPTFCRCRKCYLYSAKRSKDWNLGFQDGFTEQRRLKYEL